MAIPSADAFTRPLRFSATALGIAALTSACCQRQPHVPPATGIATHHAAQSHAEPEVIPPHGTPAWNRIVDRRLRITDSAGHGPDLGSNEWMGAVTKKSGIAPNLKPGTEAWYRAVDAKVFRPR